MRSLSKLIDPFNWRDKRPFFNRPRPLNMSQDWREVVDPSQTDKLAHVSIDLEKEFCDPTRRRGNQDTDRIATKVAKIAPVFRALGVPNYWIYSGRHQTPEDHDLYKVEPAADEPLIGKNFDSAFTSSNIRLRLEAEGKKTLLVSGVNYNYCVYDTVMHAREYGYNVILLSDLSANGVVSEKRTAEICTKLMQRAGISLVPSEQVIAHLRA
jgi:nicotinamidase-related amidase